MGGCCGEGSKELACQYLISEHFYIYLYVKYSFAWTRFAGAWLHCWLHSQRARTCSAWDNLLLAAHWLHRTRPNDRIRLAPLTSDAGSQLCCCLAGSAAGCVPCVRLRQEFLRNNFAQGAG